MKLNYFFILLTSLVLLLGGCTEETSPQKPGPGLLILSELTIPLKTTGSQAITQTNVKEIVPELTSLKITLMDESSNVLEEMEFLNLPETLQMEVTPGKKLILNGIAYATEETLYNGNIEIEPFKSGESRNISITLIPTVNLDLSLPNTNQNLDDSSESSKLPIGKSQTLKIGNTLDGLIDDTITWYVNNIEGGDAIVGTISIEGIYTPPKQLPENPKVTIKAIPQKAPSFATEVNIILEKDNTSIIESIQLRNPLETIFVNQSQQLILESLSSDQNIADIPTTELITWRSNNENILNVDSTGLVKGLQEGSAEITATALGKETSFTINIESPILTKIQLNNPSTDLFVDTTSQLQLDGHYNNNVIKDITQIDSINWSSSNEEILSVSSTGLLSAKQAGEVTIVVSALGKEISISIRVSNAPLESETGLLKLTTVNIGENIPPEITSLLIQVLDESNNLLNQFDLLVNPIPLDIDVPAGKNLFLSGSAFANEEILYNASININSFSAAETRDVSFTYTPTVSLNLSAPVSSQNPGEPIQFIVGSSQSYKINPTLIGLNNKTLLWYVNDVLGGNNEVGTINVDGVYFPPNELPTLPEITIKAEPQAAPSFATTLAISLKPSDSPVVEAIQLRNPITSLHVDQTYQFELESISSDQSINKIPDSEIITWVSSNENSLSVDKTGLIKGLQSGVTELTITALGKEIKITITITIRDAQVVKILLNNPSTSLLVDTTEQLQLDAHYDNNTHADITQSETISWSSSDDQILSVSSTGLLKALSKGIVTITVAALLKETSVIIEVNDPPPMKTDTDGDGLSDDDEMTIYLTSIDNPDSDGDGFYDAHEVAAGTDPKDELSQPTGTVIDITTEIFGSSDVVEWKLDNAPFIVNKEVSIPNGKTLAIQAGVVVKFNNSTSLNITNGGTLNIVGNSPDPQKVVFTSIKDDNVNSDSNEDGNDTNPTAGNWDGIKYASGSTGLIQHLNLRYASINIESSELNVNYLFIQHARNYALNIVNASPKLSNTSIVDSIRGLRINSTNSKIITAPEFAGVNTIALVSDSYNGIYVNGVNANPNLSGFLVNGGNVGLNMSSGAQGRYFNITLNNSISSSVMLSSNSVPLHFNDIRVSNSPSALILDSQGLPESIDIINGFVYGQNVPSNTLTLSGGLYNDDYVLSPDPLNNQNSVWLLKNVTIGSNATLTVNEGTVLKFTGGLSTSSTATLNFNGTETNPIILTSILDDSIAGDSNGDGNNTSPTAGSWDGINFNPGSAGIIQHTTLRYANANIKSSALSVNHLFIQHTNDYALNIADASPKLSNISIVDSTHGLRINSTSSQINTAPEFIGVNTISRLNHAYNGIDVSGLNANPNLSGFVVEGGNVGLYMSNGAKGRYSDITLSNAITSSVTLNNNSTPTLFNNIKVSNSPNALILESQVLPDSIDIVDGFIYGQNIPSKSLTLRGELKNGDYILSPDPLNNQNSVWLIKNLTIGSNATLTVNEGTVLKFTGGLSALSTATLNFNGSETNPITLTSILDDSIAGDSNGDGNNTSPTAGSWDGINFDPDSAGLIQYTNLHYANVTIESSKPSVNHLSIQHARYYALNIINASPKLGNISIVDSTRGLLINSTSSQIITAPEFTGINTISRLSSSYNGIDVSGLNANPSLSGFVVEGGDVGLYMSNGAKGRYSDITLSNAITSSVTLNNNSTPTLFNNIKVNNSPTALILESQVLPESIDIIGGFVYGQNIPSKSLTLRGDLNNGDYALSPDPLNNQNSVWLIKNLTIEPTATLTINQGTVLKFTGGSSVSSAGTINLNGTDANPIILTSYLDDSIAGDSNGDGNDTIPTADSWSGIFFRPGSTASVQNVNLHYANANIYSSQVNVNNLSIQHAHEYALNIVNASPKLSNILITDSTQGLQINSTNNQVFTAPEFTGNNRITRVSDADNAIYVGGSNANPSLSGFVVEGGDVGLYLSKGAQGRYSDITLNNAITSSVILHTNSAPLLFSDIKVNNSPKALILDAQVLPDSIDIIGGFVYGQNMQPKTLTLRGRFRPGDYTLSPDPLNNQNSVWLIESVYLWSNAILTVNEGTVLKFSDGAHISVYENATFNLNGTEANPIILTSSLDDSIIGDNNNDGSDTIPAAGDWSGFTFRLGSMGLIQHTNIRYASANINSSKVTVDHLSLQYAHNTALYISGASPKLSNISIFDHASNGIGINGRGLSRSTAPEFTGVNTISGTNNSYSAIWVDGSNSNPSLSGFVVEGGKVGLNITSAQGSYSDITLNKMSTSSVMLNNHSAPLQFSDIKISHSPTPLILNEQGLPNSTDILGGFVYGQNLQLKTLAIRGHINSGDYVLTSDPLNSGNSVWLMDNVRIESDASLTVNEGAVLKFIGKFSAISNATLKFNGTEEKPIFLTSILDDSVAGDSNGDGNDTFPVPGSWRGVEYRTDTPGLMQHTNVRYAGVSIDYSEPSINNLSVQHARIRGLTIHAASPKVSNISITDSTRGLLIYNVTQRVTAPEFTGNNEISGVSYDYDSIGVYGANTNPSLSGFVVNGGNIGLHIHDNARGNFSNNVFKFAKTSGIYIDTDNTPLIENNLIINNGDPTLSNNGNGAGIYIKQSDIGTLIQHNLIRHNSATVGSGVYLENLANVSLRNNLIVQNTAKTNAAGIFIHNGSHANIVNNTISENKTITASATGGVHIEADAVVTVIDNIISDNTSNSGTDVSHFGQITENNNLTSDGSFSGTDDLVGDPLFTNGWYLSSVASGQDSNSPAIDSGSDFVPNYLSTLLSATTMSDGIVDGATGDLVDIGYHYKNAAPIINPQNSIVTLDSQSIITGEITQITVEPRNNNNKPIGSGLRITSSLTNETLGNISEFRDYGNGSYGANYSSTTNLGTQEIHIFVNGIALSPIFIEIMSGP